MSALQVLGPDRGRQAVFGRIHQAQGFSFILERLQGGDRPENLLSVGGAGVIQTLNQGWLNEVTPFEPAAPKADVVHHHIKFAPPSPRAMLMAEITLSR